MSCAPPCGQRTPRPADDLVIFHRSRRLGPRPRRHPSAFHSIHLGRREDPRVKLQFISPKRARANRKARTYRGSRKTLLGSLQVLKMVSSPAYSLCQVFCTKKRTEQRSSGESSPWKSDRKEPSLTGQKYTVGFPCRFRATEGKRGNIIPRPGRAAAFAALPLYMAYYGALC